MAELPLPDPPLADDLVALRPWRSSDVPKKLMAFADPLVDRFVWRRLEPYTESDAADFLERTRTARRRGSELHLALVLADDTTDVLGGISLNDVDLDQRRAGIGYWVASEWRGRGIATRAVRLLARWAFDELALARLEISCGPDNFASQRVAERCGFVREGLLRAHLVHKGRRRDSVVFGLLPADLR